MTTRLKFPHIPRIISAGIVWSLLLTLVAANVRTKSQVPVAVLTHPFSARAHETFAQILRNNGLGALAARELAVAADLSPVLGAETTTREEKNAAAIRYWENIAATYPDYRDAYIQLAAISYTQGNLVQTKAYLTQAAALDPNGKTVSGLLEFMTKR